MTTPRTPSAAPTDERLATAEDLRALAHAVAVLRPAWDPYLTGQLLVSTRLGRPLLTVWLEVVYLALDPTTSWPTRIREDGPWRYIARFIAAGRAAHANVRPDVRAPIDPDLARERAARGRALCDAEIPTRPTEGDQ